MEHGLYWRARIYFLCLLHSYTQDRSVFHYSFCATGCEAWPFGNHNNWWSPLTFKKLFTVHVHSAQCETGALPFIIGSVTDPGPTLPELWERGECESFYVDVCVNTLYLTWFPTATSLTHMLNRRISCRVCGPDVCFSAVCTSRPAWSHNNDPTALHTGPGLEESLLDKSDSTWLKAQFDQGQGFGLLSTGKSYIYCCCMFAQSCLYYLGLLAHMVVKLVQLHHLSPYCNFSSDHWTAISLDCHILSLVIQSAMMKQLWLSLWKDLDQDR